MTSAARTPDAGANAYAQLHVNPLLRNPLNLVRQIDAAEQARSCAAAIARALQIDDAPIEILLRDILEANLPNSVGDLLARLQEIDCLPGYPGLLNFDAGHLCHFLCDATHRSRAAEDRAIPPMPIFAYPKSASAFVAELMGHLIDVPVGIVTFQHWIGIKPWAAFAARHPFGIHEHCAPTDKNVDLLHHVGCRKLVLHVRDPRQVVVSSAYHVTRPDAPESLKNEYAGLAFDAVIDRLIDWYVPTQRFWLEQWRTKTRLLGIEVLVTTFEQMDADYTGFFSEILEFFGAPSSLYERLPLSLARTLAVTRPGNLNFRGGSRDEWCTALSPRQIDRIEEIAGDAFTGIYDFSR